MSPGPTPPAVVPGRVLLLLGALAFLCSAAVGTHGVAYWDAGDYVVLGLRGGASGLLLGRPGFLLVCRGVVRCLRALGAPDTAAEPALRWVWTAVSATAAPGLALLGARLGLARGAAIAAGAALATSPSFTHTSHQVLTDGPALAASTFALVAAVDGRSAWAGALLGLAVATRETAVVHALAVALLLRPRRGAVGVMLSATCAVAVVAGLVLHAHGGSVAAVAAWAAAMRRSSTTHGLHARDVALSTAWVLAVAPMAVALGLRRLPTVRGDLRRVAWPAAAATALLLLYPDGAFSPRYVLATAPFAFLLAAGPALHAAPRRSLAVAALGLLAVPLATTSARRIAARGAALPPRLAALPAPLTLVPGHACPHARLALATSAPRDVELVCPGWDWPTDPARVLDAARARGRFVAVDVADEAWVGPREIGPRDAVRAWARARGPSVAGFVLVAPP